MKIHCSQKEDVFILELEGSLTGYEGSKLENQVTEILHNTFDPWNIYASRVKSKKSKGIILDFSKLKMMDSMGLGSLIRCLQNSVAQGCYLFLAGLQNEPLLVLEVSQTIRLFQSFVSLEGAYACLHQILKNKQALKGWEPLSA